MPSKTTDDAEPIYATISTKKSGPSWALAIVFVILLITAIAVVSIRMTSSKSDDCNANCLSCSGAIEVKDVGRKKARQICGQKGEHCLSNIKIGKRTWRVTTGDPERDADCEVFERRDEANALCRSIKPNCFGVTKVGEMWRVCGKKGTIHPPEPAKVVVPECPACPSCPTVAACPSCPACPTCPTCPTVSDDQVWMDRCMRQTGCRDMMIPMLNCLSANLTHVTTTVQPTLVSTDNGQLWTSIINFGSSKRIRNIWPMRATGLDAFFQAANASPTLHAEVVLYISEDTSGETNVQNNDYIIRRLDPARLLYIAFDPISRQFNDVVSGARFVNPPGPISSFMIHLWVAMYSLSGTTRTVLPTTHAVYKTVSPQITLEYDRCD